MMDGIHLFTAYVFALAGVFGSEVQTAMWIATFMLFAIFGAMQFTIWFAWRRVFP